MELLLFFALISGLSVQAFMGSDGDGPVDTAEDDSSDEVTEVDETEELGATFAATEDGVTLEIGEDETGSLAVIYFTDTQDDPDNFVKSDEARFYLVPEGVDWSDASWETQIFVPGTEEELYAYTLETFEEAMGLQLLGVVDLMGVEDAEDPADRFGGITANAPVAGYYLEAVTDGDNLSSFLPEDYIETKNGTAEVVVTEDTVGSDDVDWLTAVASGISVDGAGGDDTIESAQDDVTLIGAAGDDTFIVTGADATISGGGGDDSVTLTSGDVDLGAGDDTVSYGPYNSGWSEEDGIDSTGTAYGGEGDDFLSSTPFSNVTLYGGDGADLFSAYGEGTVAYGEAGADSLNIETGATGFGGQGNDTLSIRADAVAYGGAGDDVIKMTEFYHNDDGPAVATGGAGADFYDIEVRNAFNEDSGEVYLEITDFDVTEDVLQVSSYQTGNGVKGVETVEATDGSYTDVLVSYKNYQGLKGAVAVIRLHGVTDFSADQVLVA